MTDPRSEFHRLFLKNTTLGEAARHYGLTAEEMGLALHYARLTKIMAQANKGRVALNGEPVRLAPPKAIETSSRIWCPQCERQVYPNEAAVCRSNFCKAKALVA